MQYLALMHNNTNAEPTAEAWERFFAAAGASGMFRDGSAMGARRVVGPEVPDTTRYVGGFMRFDADDIAPLLALLEQHPVVKCGGSVELCELPKT
jgi:hypothetical protein